MSLLEQVLADIERLEAGAALNALRLLESLRDEIERDIYRGAGSDFDRARLAALQRQIESSIAAFEEEIAGAVVLDTKRGLELGMKLADVPLIAESIPLSPVGLPRELVLVAQAFTADRIKGLTQDIRDKVIGILQRGVLGSLSPSQMVEQVGLSLDSPGVFRSVAARAEVIVRTEVLRIQSIATQARQEANKAQVEGVGYSYLKSWLSAQDRRVRADHRATNGQVREIEQPFDVGGEKLLYPRDPAGSAENTIQCRCVSISVVKRVA